MSFSANDVALSVARRWPRQLWLLAVPLAVFWFGFWGLVWSPAPYMPPRGQPHFTPHARFLPGQNAADGGEAQRDLRVMWSPVLFALPTPMGFSRTPSAGDGHDRPRVQRPSLEPVLLAPAENTSRDTVITATPLPVMVAGDHFDVDVNIPVFTTQPVSTNVLSVELLGELAAFQTLEKPLPTIPAELMADSWGVQAHVDVGRAGDVRHVLFDPASTSSDFNGQLLQALYRWRFTPVAAEVHGVIRLFHAATRSPTTETGKP